MLLKSVFNLIAIVVVWKSSFTQSNSINNSLSKPVLVLSHERKNGHVKEVHLIQGYAVELSLQTPKDSLITYYDHKIEGKLISATDSTLTLTVTGNYRYVNYRDGSWLEDYYDHPEDSADIKTIRFDAIECIYSNREWLHTPRKVTINLTRIFIGVSAINTLSGYGSTTNSILFTLGLAGICGEFILSGKKYWLEQSSNSHLFQRRKWKIAAE